MPITESLITPCSTSMYYIQRTRNTVTMWALMWANRVNNLRVTSSWALPGLSCQHSDQISACTVNHAELMTVCPEADTRRLFSFTVFCCFFCFFLGRLTCTQSSRYPPASCTHGGVSMVPLCLTHVRPQTTESTGIQKSFTQKTQIGH